MLVGVEWCSVDSCTSVEWSVSFPVCTSAAVPLAIVMMIGTVTSGPYVMATMSCASVMSATNYVDPSVTDVPVVSMVAAVPAVAFVAPVTASAMVPGMGPGSVSSSGWCVSSPCTSSPVGSFTGPVMSTGMSDGVLSVTAGLMSPVGPGMSSST